MPDGSEALARRLNVHPLVAHIMLGRGITDDGAGRRYLEPKLTDLSDPALIPGVIFAAERIVRAVTDEQPIVIYGDYDVDGVTASAILWHTLRLAGADVTTYIPHRLDEGYGLNAEAIRSIAECGVRNAEFENSTQGNSKPLIVSVDCGITAVEPARVAKKLGVDLIITDHHQFNSDMLPDAYALVHPGLPTPNSELRTPHSDLLCGAGVAFKLAWQVAKVHCGGERLPNDFRALMIDLLSLVALGTVADVVPLVGENRVLTASGLGRIKQTRFIGLNALIDAARLRDEKIDAYHVGFVLGPRLNACGRMGHAREAVRLLTDVTEDEAKTLAEQLAKENDRRRATERAIFEEASGMVVERGYDGDDCRAIVLAKEGWHQGVVGIVASRLVERFGRPVVLMNQENGSAHGSARSIDGLSIHEAFTACGEHLDQFGGHAMAAGLTLRTERVEIFREALVAFVNGRLKPDDLVRKLTIDARVTLDDCRLELFDMIQRLAPFGRGNPTPRLVLRDVTLDRPAQRIGGEGNHLSLMLRQGSALVRAVAFGFGDEAERLPAGVRLDVAFNPKVSTWQGRRRAEVHVIDLKVL